MKFIHVKTVFRKCFDMQNSVDNQYIQLFEFRGKCKPMKQLPKSMPMNIAITSKSFLLP